MPQLRVRSTATASQSNHQLRRNTTADPKKCRSIVPFLQDYIQDCLQHDPSASTRATIIHQSYVSYLHTRTSDEQQLKPAQSINRFAKHLRCMVPQSWYAAGVYGVYKCSIKRVSRLNKRQPTFTMSNVQDYLAIDVYNRPIKFRRQFINSTLQYGAITTENILQGEILCIYSGQVIDSDERRVREERYIEQQKPMCIFSLPGDHQHIDPNYDIDGSPRQLNMAVWAAINHSKTRPNVLTRPHLDSNGSYHVILVAKFDIAKGVQLFYDYQDRTQNIADSAWLKL